MSKVISAKLNEKQLQHWIELLALSGKSTNQTLIDLVEDTWRRLKGRMVTLQIPPPVKPCEDEPGWRKAIDEMTK